MGALLLGLAPEVFADCAAHPFVDPQISASGFRDWCVECQKGTYSERPYRCDPGAGGGSASAGSNSYQQAADTVFGSIGAGIAQAMECLLGSCPQDAAREARLKAERERRKRKEEALERILQQRRALALKKRKRDFESDKRAMLGELRGALSDELAPGGLGDDLPLQVRGDDRPLLGGAEQLKPRALGESAGEIPLHVRRTRAYACVSFLLTKSNRAASSRQHYESAYLSAEAARLVLDVDYTPKVECPEVPEARAEKAYFEDAYYEKAKKKAFVMSKLYSRASTQIASYDVIRRSSARARKKAAAANREAEKLRDKVERLKTAATKPPEKESTAPEASEHESALEEALAALAEAEQAEAEAESEIAALDKERADMEERMTRTRATAEAARKDPEKIDALFKSFQEEEKPG